MQQYASHIHLIDTSTPLGAWKSNVVAMIGVAPMVRKNWGGFTNCFVYDYVSPPPVSHTGMITNGFSIYFSNDIVVEKHEIMGESRW